MSNSTEDFRQRAALTLLVEMTKHSPNGERSAQIKDAVMQATELAQRLESTRLFMFGPNPFATASLIPEPTTGKRPATQGE